MCAARIKKKAPRTKTNAFVAILTPYPLDAREPHERKKKLAHVASCSNGADLQKTNKNSQIDNFTDCQIHKLTVFVVFAASLNRLPDSQMDRFTD